MNHVHLTRVTPYIFAMFALWNIKYRWPSVYDRGETVAKQNWWKVNLITQR